MKAAIVILNYNGEEMLSKFLPSVIKNSSSEVIIVDNCSTDGSLAFLSTHYPDLRVIVNAHNTGYAGGYNKGLFVIGAEYDYFILLNSDVEVTPGWDQVIIDYLDAHPDVVVAQPKILSYVDKKYFDYAGASGGFMDGLGYPYCRGRILHTVEEDLQQYDNPIEIHWASGAAFFIRSKVFLEMGGFEPTFFSHMEEIDLCWRIRHRGMKIMVLPQSKVYHVGGATLSKTNPYKTYLNFRNNLFTLYRNTGNAEFVKIFLFRMILDGAAAFHLLFTQGKDHFSAVLSAYRDFFGKKKHLGKDPNLAPKLSFAPKEKKVFSIIWKYYFIGKKIYARL
jgi:GT2 family glycosyltransferase